MSARIPKIQYACEPELLNTLPSFYANLRQALTPGYPRNDAASHTSGERARMTDYGAEQLTHEYQLPQEAIRAVSAAQGVAMGGALYGATTLFIGKRRSTWLCVSPRPQASSRSTISNTNWRTSRRRSAKGLESASCFCPPASLACKLTYCNLNTQTR